IHRLQLPNTRGYYQKPCLRRFSTEAPVWAAIVCLGALGTGALGYAGYDAYINWRDLFPIEVRGDLKRGIRAKNGGDLEGSAYYKRKYGMDTALTLPISAFKNEPYLRLTGIAIDLAGELEEQGNAAEAYALYSEALVLIRNRTQSGGKLDSPEQEQGLSGLSGKERLRAVALAVKLGGLAAACVVPLEEEEKIRVFAVEEVLKLLRDTQNSSPGEAEALDWAKVKLPAWMSKTDVGVPLLELGDFYGRVGKLEYALPLYLQGIPSWSTMGRNLRRKTCAQRMSNIAELLVRDPTDERRKYAEAWVQNALSTLQLARKKMNPKEPIPTCELALSAALFNAGILREMAGDRTRARAFFASASEQSKLFGMEEGIVMAGEAIARLDTDIKPT
ncbi:hypothetical protein B0H17DRAFT_1074968, partial [Mycena rosella]